MVKGTVALPSALVKVRLRCTVAPHGSVGSSVTRSGVVLARVAWAGMSG